MLDAVVIQQVRPSVIGPAAFAYDVVAGDYVRDLPKVISDSV